MTADTSGLDTDAADAEPDPLPRELRKGPPRLLVFVAVVVIVAATMGAAYLLTRGSGSGSGPSTGAATGTVHEFTIPAGSFKRVAAGEDIDVIPAELHVAVGDTISVHNEDTVGQIVGPYYVPAGQTLQQTFTEDATLEGTCTAHKGGRIVIVVGTGTTEVTAPAA